MNKILIDTDILIDVLRGINPAINRLQYESKTALLSIGCKCLKCSSSESFTQTSDGCAPCRASV